MFNQDTCSQVRPTEMGGWASLGHNTVAIPIFLVLMTQHVPEAWRHNQIASMRYCHMIRYSSAI